jgi:membrane-bound metal-dependent hydrolase YbcI (DUF457 family)
MLGTQLLDVAFVPMLLSGKETIESATGGTGYGQSIIHADYTHSLLGALLIAVVAGLLSQWRWRGRSGLVVGGIVFSHWILDLLVHRADLPILPGHVDLLPLLGFGLLQYPAVSIMLEGLLILSGAVLYGRSLLALPNVRSRAAWSAAGMMALLLVLSLATDVLGIG